MAVDSAALRQFVVRLRHPNSGKTLGSGVWVGPQRVLTCAHVIDGLAEADAEAEEPAEDSGS